MPALCGCAAHPLFLYGHAAVPVAGPQGLRCCAAACFVAVPMMPSLSGVTAAFVEPCWFSCCVIRSVLLCYSVFVMLSFGVALLCLCSNTIAHSLLCPYAWCAMFPAAGVLVLG